MYIFTHWTFTFTFAHFLQWRLFTNNSVGCFNKQYTHFTFYVYYKRETFETWKTIIKISERITIFCVSVSTIIFYSNFQKRKTHFCILHGFCGYDVICIKMQEFLLLTKTGWKHEIRDERKKSISNRYNEKTHQGIKINFAQSGKSLEKLYLA